MLLPNQIDLNCLLVADSELLMLHFSVLLLMHWLCKHFAYRPSVRYFVVSSGAWRVFAVECSACLLFVVYVILLSVYNFCV